MHWLETLTALCLGAVVLVFTLMPVHWCEVPHTRDLGALVAFLALVLYLVLVDVKKPQTPAVTRTALGLFGGLAMAIVYASTPVGFVLAACLGAALGRFGLDWAA